MKTIKLISLIAGLLVCVVFLATNNAAAQDGSKVVNSVPAKNKSKSAVKANGANEAEKVLNIKSGLKFNSEKPAILSVISSEKLNLKAVGLKQGQVMSKHKAGLRTTLIVLEGKIEFSIGNEKFVLNKLDAYEIPVNVEHEIRAIEQSIFSLTQEK